MQLCTNKTNLINQESPNPAVLISMQLLVDIRVNHFKIPVGKDHKEITYVLQSIYC